MSSNILFNGDCLDELKKIAPSSVDLVYLDPPFFSQKKHSLKNKDNSKEYVFEDFWENIEEYKIYIKERLFECLKVLKNTGSIFLHCDRFASHHLRIILDEVFGEENFQSEIVWSYRRWSNAKKGLLNSHQIIFFYSKSNEFKFNHSYENYSLTTNIDQIFQKRIRDKNGKTKYKSLENGQPELMEVKKGVPLSDIWEIPYLNPKAKERIGYPTQKPILLLERIIELVTEKDDVVLDPFCGSGTTLIAAKLLNRNYIGIDILEEAIELTKKRLKNPVRSNSNLLEKGKEAYLNQDPAILKILSFIDAIPVQRNKGVDGFLKIDNIIKPIPVKIQRNTETIEDAKLSLIKSSNKNSFEKKVLIRTHDKSTGNFSMIENHLENFNIIVIDNLIEFIKDKKSLFIKR